MKRNIEEDLALVSTLRTATGRKKEVAFATLYKKYNKQLIFNFMPMVKMDEVAAEEIVLAAFMKMSDNLEKYNENGGAFSTWLYKLTQNLFIDKIRQQKCDVTVPISSLLVFNEEGNVDQDGFTNRLNMSSNEETPEKKVLVKERNKKIDVIINNLSNDIMKELIKMKYFENRSYEEMAQVLNIPLGSVKAHLFRAKEILKREFETANINLIS